MNLEHPDSVAPKMRMGTNLQLAASRDYTLESSDSFLTDSSGRRSDNFRRPDRRSTL
jgi:hypothetical protein